jgi:hypothetical protein
MGPAAARTELNGPVTLQDLLMKKSIFLHAAALLLIAAICSGETPETILIRSTLGNDLSGHRRADADLVLSAYYEDFAGYQGNGNADPRAWSVLYEDLDGFTVALNKKLSTHRYETERTLPFIHVRGKKAMVTSIDSGKVVDRGTGEVRSIKTRRFWTLRKVEEEWLITGLVEALGDSAQVVPEADANADEIVKLLLREKQGWEDGDAGSISGLFDEEFIGYDGYGTIKPETWKIIFGGSEELEQWLDKRLERTSYKVDRRVVFTSVDANQREALALTSEKLTTTYEKGDAAPSIDRYVLWTLSRRTGDWKITNMCYNIGIDN